MGRPKTISKIDKEIFAEELTKILGKIETDNNNKIDLEEVIGELKNLSKENKEKFTNQKKIIGFTEEEVKEFFKKETIKQLEDIDETVQNRINSLMWYSSSVKNYKEMDLKEFCEKSLEKRRDWYKTKYYDFEYSGFRDRKTDGKLDLETLQKLKNSDSEFIDKIYDDVQNRTIDCRSNYKSPLNKEQMGFLEFKFFIIAGMEETIKEVIPQANEKINQFPEFKNHKIDIKNLSKGDLKAVSNILNSNKKYPSFEIKKDLAFSKLFLKDFKDLAEANEMREIIETNLDKSYDRINGELFLNEKKEEIINLLKESKEKTFVELDKKSFSEFSKETLRNAFGNDDEIMKLPFKIIYKGEDIYKKNNDFKIFNKEKFNEVKEFVIESQGEEFWSNININSIEDWATTKEKVPELKNDLEFVYRDKEKAFVFKDMEKYKNDCIQFYIEEKVLTDMENQLKKDLKQYYYDKGNDINNDENYAIHLSSEKLKKKKYLLTTEDEFSSRMIDDISKDKKVKKVLEFNKNKDKEEKDFSL